jgi:hypothetical protein
MAPEGRVDNANCLVEVTGRYSNLIVNSMLCFEEDLVLGSIRSAYPQQ